MSRTRNTVNQGVTAREFYGGKNNEGLPGDRSAQIGIPKQQGIAQVRGVPHTGTANTRKPVPVPSKPKCLYGRDFGEKDCGAYPSGGTPYCVGHLRKLDTINDS